MKKLTLFVVLSMSSIVIFAEGGVKPVKSEAPHYYIMMKKGKLIEVKHGAKVPVRHDVTLVNQTTIHPNGSIDASSGQNLQLKEGEYITMDGKIRKLKDMPHPKHHPKPKPKPHPKPKPDPKPDQPDPEVKKHI